MNLKDSFKKINPKLALIMLLALFLYGWNIWNASSANNYYTAAIVSMTKSWHNFWYASFDPAGFITVDKPPVALWFMAISAKIFGVHGWSIVLPSVIFGVLSVYLIYAMVKPYFGKTVAEISALVMALTPIAAANARTNNMDTTLVFFLLLAGLLLQKAVKKQKLSLLLISFALVGISFNIKMLQAFMILPAMYLFYLIASKVSFKKRLAHMWLATVVLAIFTLIWPLSVDLTSASKRPYVGSSSHNSVLELAFSYNGAQRLLGQSTGIGGRFSGMGNKKSTTKKPSSNSNAPAMPNQGKSTTKAKAPTGQMGGQGGPGQVGGKGGNTGTQNNPFNIGTIGPFRLFGRALGGQIGWLLAFGIAGLIASFYALMDRKKKFWQLNVRQKQLVFWAAWLIPVAGFFSVASFFHPYYTVMLAPPIAVLAGIGFSQLFKEKNRKLRYFLAGALAITGLLQAWYVAEYSMLFAGLLAGLSLVAVACYLYFSQKNNKKQALFAKVSIFILLLAPGFWALTPALASESAAVPSAGPSLLTSGNNSGGLGSENVDQKMLKYLNKHAKNTKYLFATMDSNTAAPYIIKTGKAVMTIGGYNGTDNAISLKEFKKLVKQGKVKYFYLSGKTTNSAIVKWVKKHGTVVYGKSSSSISKVKTLSFKKPSAKSGMTPGQGGPGGQMGGTQGQGGPGQMGGAPSKKAKSNQKTKASSKAGAQGGPGGQSQGVLYKLN